VPRRHAGATPQTQGIAWRNESTGIMKIEPRKKRNRESLSRT
jgi:hypothetical protein